jgi:hypothetical protein
MKRLALGRYGLSISAAAALLVGCDGSQSPVGMSGALPQSRAIAARAAHGKSWMLPGASHGDLIYALETARESGGEIFAYPSGELVGYFGFSQSHFFSYGICSDRKGNVFAGVGGVSSSYSFIDEFAHDGSLIGTLGADFLPISCSVDPSTGNLAVVEGEIAIYRNARGAPRHYRDSSFQGYESCSYDDRGNLFVVGFPPGGYFALAEILKGKVTFRSISLNKKLGYPASIQWDGNDLAIEAQTLVRGQLGRYVVYRVQVSGSKAKVLGTPQFKDWRRPGRSTILQDAFVAVYGTKAKSIGSWRYPSGGRAYKISKGVASSRLSNLTISLAPH